MYKNIWFKLHLILGLSAGFILLIVGFTGSMLSFEKEILSAINQDTYKVSVLEQGKLSTKELLEKFQEQKPQAKINSLPTRSYDFGVEYNNQRWILEYDGSQHFKYNKFF
ncbi:MAG: PepSY domain-containing protein, partial [Campylobacterales bacterium]|nr:PepSY domain-containing protein [Campylobacterales bacterium]